MAAGRSELTFAFKVDRGLGTGNDLHYVTYLNVEDMTLTQTMG